MLRLKGLCCQCEEEELSCNTAEGLSGCQHPPSLLVPLMAPYCPSPIMLAKSLSSRLPPLASTPTPSYATGTVTISTMNVGTLRYHPPLSLSISFLSFKSLKYNIIVLCLFSRTSPRGMPKNEGHAAMLIQPVTRRQR